jgi:aminodeoxyfutalosine synthase
VHLDEVGAATGGGRLTLEEIRELWASADPVGIGMLADEVRRRRHGDRATFLRVARVEIGEAGAFPSAAGEIRVSGPSGDPDAAVASIATIVRRADGVPVTAFSLADLERTTSGTPALTEYARRLAGAGLAAVDEAPLDRLQDAPRAVDAVLAAGLPVARFTVGSIEHLDLPAFLSGVRHLQKTTAAVRVVAPLPRDARPAAPTTGYDDVRLVAIARLALDNVASIQVDWSAHGPKLAQVALVFGADDLDNVSPIDDVSEGRRRAPLEEVRRNIRSASLTPVERDGRFAVRE